MRSPTVSRPSSMRSPWPPGSSVSPPPCLHGVRAPHVAVASLTKGGGIVSPRNDKALKIVVEIAVPLAIIAAWQLWAASADSRYFPPPLDNLRGVPGSLALLEFGTHVVPSLERILLGFGLAVHLRDRARHPIGLSAWSHRFAMPHIEYWRAMPPPALLPISVVLLHSIGNSRRCRCIAFFCFFPVLLNTMEGVRGIDPTLMETARAYGVPRASRSAGSCFPPRSHGSSRGCARVSRWP